MEDILKIFKTERTKKIVLTELFQLIYADGVFQNEERDSVILIKAHFGFDSNEFGSFKDWIRIIKELSNSKNLSIESVSKVKERNNIGINR